MQASARIEKIFDGECFGENYKQLTSWGARWWRELKLKILFFDLVRSESSFLLGWTRLKFKKICSIDDLDRYLNFLWIFNLITIIDTQFSSNKPTKRQTTRFIILNLLPNEIFLRNRRRRTFIIFFKKIFCAKFRSRVLTCLEAFVINMRNHDKAHSDVLFSRACFPQIKAPLFLLASECWECKNFYALCRNGKQESCIEVHWFLSQCNSPNARLIKT